MTTATRDALNQVSRILHDAGWDAPAPNTTAVTDQELEMLRTAFAGIRGDHLELLQRTLGAGERLEDVGRRMGLPPEQARSLFREALDRLRALTAVAL